MTPPARRGSWPLGVAWLALALVAGACATAPGPSPTPPPAPATRGPIDAAVGAMQTGDASWYGPAHHGRTTSSGEPFDMHALTAAHPSLPVGTTLLVTNLANGRSVRVRVNDRGPAVPGRIIDLSRAAADRLGFVGDGVTPVRIQVLALPR